MPPAYDEIRYQVFVSSTFTDLKDEREKVLQAILECKAFPSGMELFPSADDEQFEFIKREIDSSDYYVVIVGGRYGSISDDGHSFTEKEFDYAFAHKKPILAFLIEDLSSLPLSKSEPEARSLLDAFREKAKRSRLVKFFRNPDELKGQVIQALNYQFKVNPMRGWIPAGKSNREDLEEIRKLQSRVLQLQSENAELRAAGRTAKQYLAQGNDTISWEIDSSTIFAQRQDGAKMIKIPFSEGTDRLETTWDELLCALFWGGTSSLNSSMVAPRILGLLAIKLPKTRVDEFWHFAISRAIRDPRTMNLSALEKVKSDVHRQFAGLGLIEEAFESGSLVDPVDGRKTIPFARNVWRLTHEGQEYLALIRGFRRNTPPQTQ